MTHLCPACLTENSLNAITCSSCGFALQILNQNDLYHLPAQTTLINTENNRSYQIKNTLGEGGFGITYKGFALSNFLPVAIKEFWPEKAARREQSIIWPSSITPENKKEQLKKFIEEGYNISLCNHPNIVKVYDWFLANNTAYIVMEFIEGSNLYNIIKKKGKLNNTQAKKYFLEVANSLILIHQKNILHRDIKPDNIMIDQQGRTILIDFGNAREFIANKTNVMTKILTPGYAPLEQYSKQGKKSPSLDIYSLCATFYYALTGTEPPAATDRIHIDPLIPPRQIVSSIDPLLEQVLLTGLKVNAEERFVTADDLIQALQGKWTSPTLKKARRLVKENKLFEAVQIYKKCLNESDTFIELAILQSHLNSPEAEIMAQKAIQVNPQDSRGYGVLGTLYCQKKNWNKAVYNLQKAEQLLPNQSWILANLAWALAKINQWDVAEETLERAAQISANQPFILGLQAWISGEKQQWKQIIRYARQALFYTKTGADIPLKTWVYPCLLRALVKVTQNTTTKDLERASQQFIQECPRSNLAKAIEGWRLAKSGHWKQALIYFTQVNQQEPKLGWTVLNQATTEEYLGNLQFAIQAYQIYLQEFPSNYQILYRLGLLNGKLGQWNSAKRYLEECLKLKSDYAEAHHNLGWVLIHIRINDGQIEYFRPLLEAYKKAILFYYKQQNHQLVTKIKQAFKDIGVEI